MQIVIGIFLFVGGLFIGATIKQPTIIKPSSVLMECKSFCGKGRTLSVEPDGSCECTK